MVILRALDVLTEPTREAPVAVTSAAPVEGNDGMVMVIVLILG